MIKNPDILSELREIAPAADQWSCDVPYRIPEGYFEGLAGQVLRRIKAEEAASVSEELEMLSPLLSGINKKNPFTAPEGYFEDLSRTTVHQLKPGPAASNAVTISLTKRVFRYAVAAAVAGVIAVSAWFLVKDPGEALNGNAAVAQKESVLPNEKALENISESEMAAYIEGSTLPVTYETISPATDIKDEDVKLMLAEVSDQELQSYLEQNNPKQIIN